MAWTLRFGRDVRACLRSPSPGQNRPHTGASPHWMLDAIICLAPAPCWECVSSVTKRVRTSAVSRLTGPERAPLRICQAPSCGMFFLGSPRWCCAARGNRARAARHYQRTRARETAANPKTEQLSMASRLPPRRTAQRCDAAREAPGHFPFGVRASVSLVKPHTQGRRRGAGAGLVGRWSPRRRPCVSCASAAAAAHRAKREPQLLACQAKRGVPTTGALV
jgi:hypothetical protein